MSGAELRVLTAEDVEAVARRVVELLPPVAAVHEFVDAKELADRLGVSVDYVYSHARELGAMRLGDGPKARLRFEVERARAALAARAERSRARGRARATERATPLGTSRNGR